jgi:hypothetical protein
MNKRSKGTNPTLAECFRLMKNGTSDFEVTLKLKTRPTDSLALELMRAISDRFPQMTMGQLYDSVIEIIYHMKTFGNFPELFKDAMGRIEVRVFVMDWMDRNVEPYEGENLIQDLLFWTTLGLL